MRHATMNNAAISDRTARGAARPRVITWLGGRDRTRVEAATADHLTPVHVDALPAVLDAITTGRADAVLLSAARVQASDVPLIARLVRGFPSTPVAGYVGENDDASSAISGTLLLGRAGVLTMLDCRIPSGWTALRSTFNSRRMPDAFLRACVDLTLGEIDGKAGHECTDGLARFFALVFTPDVTSAKLIGARLGVRSCTLMSRFYRAGLPSPKRYLAMARLVWAAHLVESPGLSISAIAARLDASSPQSFHRTVRLLTGHTATEFRRTATGAKMFDEFCSTHIAPYRDALRTFEPLGTTSGISPAVKDRPGEQDGPTQVQAETQAARGRAA